MVIASMENVKVFRIVSARFLVDIFLIFDISNEVYIILILMPYLENEQPMILQHAWTHHILTPLQGLLIVSIGSP